MKKTAITQAMEEFERLKENSNLRDMIYLDGVLAVLEGFIPTEREQIEEAYEQGATDMEQFHSGDMNGKQYFLNTYGNGE